MKKLFLVSLCALDIVSAGLCAGGVPCGDLCKKIVNKHAAQLQSMGRNVAGHAQITATPEASWLSAAGPSDSGSHQGFRVSLTGDQLIDLVPGKVYQMDSVKQQHEECGCYVKYNALAIADLIEHGCMISPQTIKTRVEQFLKSSGVANWLDETDEFVDLCAVLPDQNVYMIKIEQAEDGQALRILPAGSTTDPNAYSMDSFWAMSEDKIAKLIGYFVVNLDASHWVLIVALKEPGMDGPAYVYLDSKNYPVEKELLARWLVTYLRQCSLDLILTIGPDQLQSEKIGQ